MTGVDFDPRAVEWAVEQFGGDGVEFQVGDCHQLDRLAGPFDLITNFENLEHLPQPERFLEAAGRLLGPQGRLLVSTPNRATLPPFVAGRPRNAFHFHEWYREEFETLLRKHFAEVEIWVQVESRSLDSRRGSGGPAAGPALGQSAGHAGLAQMAAGRKAPAGLEATGRTGRALAGRLSDSPGRDRLAIGHARLPSGRVSSTAYRRVLI